MKRKAKYGRPFPGPLLIVILTLMAPSISLGSAQDLFGFGVRGPALNGAVITLTEGFESVYYNPAGLTETGSRRLALTYMSAFYDLSVDASSLVGSDATDVERPGGIAFGAAIPLPLPGPLNDLLYLGLGLYIPDTVLIRARVPTPYTPYFPVIGNRANTLAIHGAVGLKLMEWLRVGAGVKALARLDGSIEVAPNAFGDLGSSVTDELKTTYSAIAGLTLGPFSGFRLGAVYRGEEKAPFTLPVKAGLGDSFPLEIPEILIQGIAQFDPQQVGFGLSWTLDPRFSTEIAITWNDWSAFPTPIENATPAVLEQPPPAFVDTWSVRAGVESRWKIGSQWEVTGRLGYLFEPTPVPTQKGGHNFLDNDRHISSFGIGAHYAYIPEDDKGAFSLHLDLFAQHHLLVDRTHTKKEGANATETAELENNAGFPSIGSQGQILVIGTGLEVQF